ncbi:MAG: NAD(P)-binding protein [Pseudomonadota bacterium]
MSKGPSSTDLRPQERSDRALGMGSDITRRDFINGFGAMAGAMIVPGAALGADRAPFAAAQPALGRPPERMGMRGNHDGAFEVAHALARGGRTDFGPVLDSGEKYDLVVVGAGLSGLTAAYLFHQKQPDARILLLDNHDDFGGHAKRNEFEVGGQRLIGYGGTQTFEAPAGYPRAVRRLLRDLGVDLKRLGQAYDQDFYRRHKLAGAVLFAQDQWGERRLVPYDLGGFWSWLPLAPGVPAHEAVAAMPMSPKAKAQMLRVLTDRTDRFESWSRQEREEYLYTLTYAEFLRRHLDVTEPEVFRALAGLSTDATVDIDQCAAGDVFLYGTLPGGAVTGVDVDFAFEDDPYIHHFPDGLASVARLIVRRLIPSVAPGDTMEDIVTASFDYGKLDLEDQQVRVRLNSTAVNVTHTPGDGPGQKEVAVTYVANGQAQRVHGDRCILACNNAIIPALCPQLPAPQRAALQSRIRAPIIYTNVALTNWRAFEKLGVGCVAMPGGYFVNAMVDFPVSIGDYKFSPAPDSPVVVHMERFLFYPDPHLTPPELYSLGRHELMTTPFSTIERNARAQLTELLGPGGFDPAKDIAGITVNRWAHGYAYSYDWRNDEFYDDWNDERFPHVAGRRPFGQIAIANSDAGASALFPQAAMQAHRAVQELT